MNKIDKQKKIPFFGVCFIICSAFFGSLYFFGGIHYAVNDDIAMREIASGVRSGMFDGHLVYIKYPLGWFISKLYSLASKNVDWYGVVLLSALLISASLITYCVNYNVKDKWLETCFHLLNILVIMRHIFFFQWTICAMYCGMAGVIYYFSITYDDKYHRLIQKVIAMCMLWLCYLIRDKVLFIVVAISALLVLYKEFIICKKAKTALSNSLVLGLVLILGAGGIEIIHDYAYSSADWQAYDEFNKARSLLYDFYKLPDYEENQEFYLQENISVNTYNNLKKYSLLYDPEIDAELITEIVNYSKNSIVDSGSNLKRAMINFKALIFSKNYFWTKCIMLLMCFAFFFFVYRYKKWGLGILGGCQLIIWSAIMFYIVYGGRYPDHIIYTMAIVFIIQYEALCLQILNIETSILMNKKYFIQGMAAIAAAGCVVMFDDLNVRSQQTDAMNYSRDQIKNYMTNNSENLYILPVLTFAKYTDRFEMVHAEYNGKQLTTGGWLSHSPLIEQRMKLMGIMKNPEDFVNNDNIYILNWDGTSMDYILQSIGETCQSIVECTVADVIETTEGRMNVYSLYTQEYLKQ